MTQKEVKIGSVGGVPLAIIVKSVDRAVGQWYAPNRLTLTIVAIRVLVDIVT